MKTKLEEGKISLNQTPRPAVYKTIFMNKLSISIKVGSLA